VSLAGRKEDVHIYLSECSAGQGLAEDLRPEQLPADRPCGTHWTFQSFIALTTGTVLVEKQKGFRRYVWLRLRAATADRAYTRLNSCQQVATGMSTGCQSPQVEVYGDNVKEAEGIDLARTMDAAVMAGAWHGSLPTITNLAVGDHSILHVQSVTEVLEMHPGVLSPT
ncbi:hypothetical protein FOZ60_016698, partial [Perkinsus olseni]